MRTSIGWPFRGRAPLALIGALVLFVISAGPTSAMPDAFEATYILRMHGLTLGQVHLRLTRDGDRYEYRSTMQARGPAALFYRDRIREYSSGMLTDDSVRPETYDYRRTGGSREQDDSIRFGAADGDTVIRYRGETRIDPLPDEALDPMSLHLALMQDVARVDDGRLRYLIAQPRRARVYAVEIFGEERVETQYGTFDTVRVEVVGEYRIKDLAEFDLADVEIPPLDDDSRTTFWFAPELGYLPVRIRHADPDDGVGVLELAEVDRLVLPDAVEEE